MIPSLQGGAALETGRVQSLDVPKIIELKATGADQRDLGDRNNTGAAAKPLLVGDFVGIYWKIHWDDVGMIWR